MSVVANVAINVDAKNAVQQLNSVNTAAKNVKGGLDTAALGAKGLGSALISALAPIISITAAVEAFRRTTSAAFERSQSETRLKALTSAYGETAQATALATAASGKFGLTQTDANKAFADAYGRLRPLGFSLKEISGVYDGFNVLSKKAALSTAEAGSVFTQLSQALGSGTLRGDEFNRMAESMPEILTLVSKELGVAQGDLRKMAEGGKITADVVVSALQKIAKESGDLDKFLDPSAKSMDKLAQQSQDAQVAIGELFKPAAIAGMNLLAEAAGFVAKNIKQIAQVSVFLGTFALVINGVAIATKVWAAATTALAVAKRAAGIAAAFLVSVTNPAGLALVAAALGAATLAAVGLGKAMGESGNKAEEAKIKQKGLDSVLDGQKLKQDAITGSLDTQLQRYTAIRGQIEAQIASLERGASINAARYSAEKAILDLTGQQLEREYGLATTARQRLNIAAQIFNNSIAIARVEAQQAIEQIKLAQRQIQNQVELQKLKWYEIKAEGELQILKAKDAQAADEKRKQLGQALAAQDQVLRSTYDQVGAQKEIGKYQEMAVKAQYEGKVLTAQTAFESRLVSKEIGLSQGSAVQLSNHLASSSRNSTALSGYTAQVARNAAASATMFIRVANSAEAAANSIRNAANQQARLNALSGQQPSGNATTTPQAFAKGGYVGQGTLAVVGEAGPEYIIPAGKMAEAASNYLNGARGGAVIPAFANGGYVGGNAQINVTTGPVMQQGGQQYVTIADLEKAMRNTADGIYASLSTPSGRYATGVR